ncbi:hypothetical protein MH148_16710, partial [Bacillus altitudinis]|nr:hypothetical protein [Bacillus altitudinis]
KSRKNEYWRGANLTFVSTSTQDRQRMRGFVYTLGSAALRTSFFHKKSPSAGLSTLISKLVPMNDWLKYIKIQQDPS